MGFIKEPKGVDFIINSEPLTKEEEEKLSEFIALRKREIAEMKKHEPGHGGAQQKKSKRAKNAKSKPKSKQEI